MPPEKRSGPEANSRATFTENTNGYHPADAVNASAWCADCRALLVRPESVTAGVCLGCWIVADLAVNP